jgi:CDP-6-deoxy-D-xylo-4-hexulose-3-dehydrase
VQLDRLDDCKEKRLQFFRQYIATLKVDPYTSRYYSFPIGEDDILWLALPLACSHRIELLKELEFCDVRTRVTMAGNILRHPIYKARFPEQAAREFPVANQVTERFRVGCHHELDSDDVARLCGILIDFARAHLGQPPARVLEALPVTPSPPQKAAPPVPEVKLPVNVAETCHSKWFFWHQSKLSFPFNTIRR